MRFYKLLPANGLYCRSFCLLLREIMDNNKEILATKQRFGIIGNSEPLNDAIRRALLAAKVDLSVLINGESGAGKEFFPKIIHDNSSRKHNKYIAVNCGAIPEGTIDSELFGHEKGAFTGAVAARKGYFEEANGGTIFLDEVAELPMPTQARLLRILENGEYIKVGASVVQKSNVRIIAATNVDLRKAVSERKFREDLFHRLSTIPIVVPALRDRGDDILLLTRKFAGDFANRYRTEGVVLDDSAKAELLNYPWPGNVRQLKNVVEQINLFESGNTLNASQVRKYLPDFEGFTGAVATQTSTQASSTYEQEREMLLKMILQINRELEDLKEKVYTLMHGTGAKTDSNLPVLINRHTSIANDDTKLPTMLSHSDYMPHIVEDVTDSTLSLEDSERELIRKALERNGNNRRKTAGELKISERTLYRKIKEYGLENPEL